MSYTPAVDASLSPTTRRISASVSATSASMSMSFETAMVSTSVAGVGANLFAKSSLLDVGCATLPDPASAADGAPDAIDAVRKRGVHVAAHPEGAGELHRHEPACPRDDQPRGLEDLVPPGQRRDGAEQGAERAGQGIGVGRRLPGVGEPREDEGERTRVLVRP